MERPSITKGKRWLKTRKGKAFLRELRDALLTMTRHELSVFAYVDRDGRTCPMTAVYAERMAKLHGASRGEVIADVSIGQCFVDMRREIAEGLGIPADAAYVVERTNDCFPHEPQEQYEYMLAWVTEMLAEADGTGERSPSAGQTQA